MESTLELLRGHRFAIVSACYACGIILVAESPLAVGISATLLAACTVILATSISRQKFLVVMLCAFAAGESAATLSLWRLEHRPFSSLDGRHVVVEAVALERPRVNESATFRARIVAVQVPATTSSNALVNEVALVSSPTGGVVGIAGKRIIVRGRVDLPGGPRNDGEPGEREMLADQGVGLMIAVHRTSDVVVFGAASGWEAWWARARASVADAVEQRLPPLEATVLEGILWGDRGNLPASLRQEFSDTGTVHVLTTAGLHLGIMAGFMAWLVALFPLRRPIRTSIVLVGAWLYAALAGMHLPTLRAATMLTAGTAAVELGRGRTASSIFAAAACAVMVPHPLVILSPSFSMSFACVIGIALVSPVLSELGLRDGFGGLPRIVVEVVRTSLAVQIALWPLQALYFNAFTPYAVLANIVVVPLVGLIMAVGALFSVAALTFPALAIPLVNIVWWGLTIVVSAVQFFASLPVAHVDMPPPSHIFLIMYWIGLAALAAALRFKLSKARVALAGLSAVAILSIVYCLPGILVRLDRNIHLDAIDVGQADCLLIRAPGGHAMLVDGGGRLERTSFGAVVAAPLGDRVATRTVMPFLLRHWVPHLDVVVLTHPHG
ncbi:MAG TPA: ComEC/Rec2 family competence protein, partial [Candidatus Acidoferrales bacterium]|nr:ComEC/Rec2 family competence protein [Candidatus Acidoferrales bacterium]